MTCLPVKDLKRRRDLWKRLERDRELIIIRDGQPRAILIGVSPDEVETVLPEIRRALFSAAVGRARRRAARARVGKDEVEDAIRESRKRRKRSRSSMPSPGAGIHPAGRAFRIPATPRFWKWPVPRAFRL